MTDSPCLILPFPERNLPPLIVGSPQPLALHSPAFWSILPWKHSRTESPTTWKPLRQTRRMDFEWEISSPLWRIFAVSLWRKNAWSLEGILQLLASQTGGGGCQAPLTQLEAPSGAPSGSWNPGLQTIYDNRVSESPYTPSNRPTINSRWLLV